MSNAPRVIRRYANRKLYDTEESQYVTLARIGEMVREGVDVRIVDARSGEDLTAETLARVVLEGERARRRRLPLGTLHQLIRSGEDLWNRQIARPVQTIRSDAERRATELRDHTTRALDDFQRRIEETVRSLRSAVERIGQPGGDIERIETRLAAIEARLAAVEAAIRELRAQGGDGA